jgi:hypothetical protein
MTQSMLPNRRSEIALDRRCVERRRPYARYLTIRRAWPIGDADDCDAPLAAL